MMILIGVGMPKNEWKTKFSKSDIALISKLMIVLSDIEKSTIDPHKKQELVGMRMQGHSILIKMMTVNQDMHFAF